MIFFRDFIQGIELPVYSLRRKAFKVFALCVFSDSEIEKTYKAGVSAAVLTLLRSFSLVCMALYVFFRFEFQTGVFFQKLQKMVFQTQTFLRIFPAEVRTMTPVW